MLVNWYHLHRHWTDNLSFIQYILWMYARFTLCLLYDVQVFNF